MPKNGRDSEKVSNNQRYSHLGKLVEPSNTNIMTENRNGKGWTDWCNPSDSEKSDEKPTRSRRRRDDDDDEDGRRYRDRRDDRQGHRRFRADGERQINGKKYSMDRPRNGDRVLYSITLMAGPQAYSIQVMYKPVDVADNVII